MDFADFDVQTLVGARTEHGQGVYSLARGIVPEIAMAYNHTLPVVPSEQAIRALIEAVAPNKHLAKDRAFAVQVLGNGDEAVATQIAAGWLEYSRIMEAVSLRPFCWPAAGKLPEQFDYAIWQGGVANWMLRRLMEALRLSPSKIGTLILPTGNDPMDPGEHQLVQSWLDNLGTLPTQQEFADRFIVSMLELAWFNAAVLPVQSGQGRDVCTQLIEAYPDIRYGTVLAVGNAPATIQVAGQFRAWARKKWPEFDADGTQLYMVGDHFSLARRGQGKATHQDPLTGIGALLRAVLYIQRAVADFAAV